jgi:flavin reductase (DIM6/NTAB) family NADH-FMN oxidoreductase RutF/rubredoxin
MNSEAFFKLTYGIYMVSSKDGEQLSSFIANTVFQVTAEPPQIAISCHKNNTSAKIIDQSGIFSVSVLEKETDAGLIGLFGYQSGNEQEKFDRVDYKIGKTGAPIILSHSVAYFECKVVDKYDVGSHYLFIGKVEEGELLQEEKDPLTYKYFRDEMRLMAPERAPTYVDKNKIEKRQEEEQQTKEPEEVNKSESKNDFGPNYICTICAYVYDPAVGDEAQGIPPGTPFEELPEDWICPICAAAKSMFMLEN